MVLCFVPGCKNRSDHRNWKTNVRSSKGTRKLTFHSIPKDATTCRLWMDILGINSPSIPSGARVCSEHFEEQFFDRSNPSLVRLKPNALPRKYYLTETIHTSGLSPNRPQNSFGADENVEEKVVIEASQELSQLKHLVDRSTSPITDFTLQGSTSKVQKATNVSLHDLSAVTKPSKSQEDKSTMVSADLIYHSPEKSRLRQRITILTKESRRKIRSLQQSLRRQTDQIATLKNVLKTLKEKQLLNEEQADMLGLLGGSEW